MSNSLQPHELQHTFWFFSSCSSTGFYVSKSWGTLLLQNIFSRGNCRNRVEKRFGCIFYLGILSRFSHVPLFDTLWTVAHQAPLSKGFSRQEYWSRLPCPPPGALSNPGIEPASPVAPALLADSLSLSHQGSPGVGYQTGNQDQPCLGHLRLTFARLELPSFPESLNLELWPLGWWHPSHFPMWTRKGKCQLWGKNTH